MSHKDRQTRNERNEFLGEEKPCAICNKQCLPYGYTNNWGHLCSRMCSDKYDELRIQPDFFVNRD